MYSLDIPLPFCVLCFPPVQSGGECMVLPNVSPEDAQKLFPQHHTENVPSGKPYIRITPQPQ